MSKRTTSGRNSSTAARAWHPSVRRAHLVAQEAQEHRQAVGRVLIVIHHQNAPPDGRRSCGRWRAPLGRTRRNRPVLRRERQPHHELTPLARTLTPRLHGAAMHLQELPHQRKPDSQPALAALLRPVHLREQLEDAGSTQY